MGPWSNVQMLLSAARLDYRQCHYPTALEQGLVCPALKGLETCSFVIDEHVSKTSGKKDLPVVPPTNVVLQIGESISSCNAGLDVVGHQRRAERLYGLGCWFDCRGDNIDDARSCGRRSMCGRGVRRRGMRSGNCNRRCDMPG